MCLQVGNCPSEDRFAPLDSGQCYLFTNSTWNIYSHGKVAETSSRVRKRVSRQHVKCVLLFKRHLILCLILLVCESRKEGKPVLHSAYIWVWFFLSFTKKMYSHCLIMFHLLCLHVLHT